MRSAFSYFSIFPVGIAPPPSAPTLAWLPLVGAAIGFVAGSCAWLVSLVAPSPLVIAAAFTLPIVLSGAIHLDGFLDSCDALAASVAPERRLEILKDPRHGTFALAGFAVVAAWTIAGLALISPVRMPLDLAWCAAVARSAAVLNALVYPYGRGGSVASAFAERPPAFALAGGFAVLLAAGFAIAPSAPLLALAALALGRWGAGAIAGRQGGGLVGDSYGFLVVVLETALVVGVALVSAGPLRSGS